MPSSRAHPQEEMAGRVTSVLVPTKYADDTTNQHQSVAAQVVHTVLHPSVHHTHHRAKRKPHATPLAPTAAIPEDIGPCVGVHHCNIHDPYTSPHNTPTTHPQHAHYAPTSYIQKYRSHHPRASHRDQPHPHPPLSQRPTSPMQCSKVRWMWMHC